jgi:hypothetical protein
MEEVSAIGQRLRRRIRTTVTAAESSSDPRQPSRLLKKRNMRPGTPCPRLHAGERGVRDRALSSTGSFALA